MAHHDDDIDARRCRYQRGSNRRSNTTSISGRQTIDAFDRTADSAHHIRTFQGDFIGDGRFCAREYGLRFLSRHIHCLERALHDLDHRFCRYVAIESRIGICLFESHDLSIAIAAIGRNDDTRTGVMNTIGECFIAEAAKDGRIDDT